MFPLKASQYTGIYSCRLHTMHRETEVSASTGWLLSS